MIAVDRLAFAEALKRLKPIVRGGGQLPILRNVLLAHQDRPDGRWLTASGTDLENTLVCQIPGLSGDGEGFEALVELDRLSAFVFSDWAREIEVEHKGERLVLSGQTKSRIALAYETDAFPSMPAWPAEGWVKLGADVVEETARAAGFCATTKGSKFQEHLGLVWMRGNTDFVEMFGTDSHALWLRRVAAEVPAGWGMGVARECAALVAGMTKEGVEVAEGKGKIFFRAEGWILAHRKEEMAGNGWRLIDDPRTKGEGFRALPQLSNLIPVIEAVGAQGSESSKMVFASGGGETTKVSLRSDAVEAEGTVTAELPPYRTLYPKLLLKVLTELQRLEEEAGIEVGSIPGAKGLRFEAGAMAMAIVTGL